MCLQDIADLLTFFAGPHELASASEQQTMWAVREDLVAHARLMGMLALEKVGSSLNLPLSFSVAV